MDMTIKSRVFNYGNEHEAEWPPRFPEKSRGLVGYIDPETKEFKEGYPPNPNNQFGTPPTVIFDSMPAAYHEGACRTVESRKEWNRLDQEHGTLTFGNIEEPRRYAKTRTAEEKRELKRDRRRASEEALKMVRANPRHISQKWQKEAEKQEKTAKKIAENYGIQKELKGII
jgi:hypothetical protein